ncbi:MAG: hypothetical protein V4671_26855 [Armatimonadota bacterium]
MQFWLSILLMALAILPQDSARADDWVYLDNGSVRIGVKKSSGACIGYLSPGGSTKNLLNHYDQGRFVQQSYYGAADGSLWVKKPWRFNPVQGGNYQGTPSELKEFRSTKSTLYAKITPRNWAGGALVPEVTMEEWIELVGPVAKVRYRMTYSGTVRHAARHQEIPAIFTDANLSTLVTYEAAVPWTNDAVVRKIPGWPNQPQKLTESWAAYVDARDFGVGAYVPIATEATCYRYKGGSGSDCSYIAPLTTFALTPNLVFEYELYLTAGTSREIRSRFYEIHRRNERKPAKPSP